MCEAIYAAGMEGFYQRTPDGSLLAPPPTPPEDAELFDLEEVQEEFVTKSGQEREIHLLVEGIHCAACVWLIERTLNRLPGVLSAQVNLSGKRLLLRWDNERIKLSRIISKLGRIGYAATPFDPEAAEGTIKKQNRALLFRMAFAGFAMMNLLWISIALYSGADKGEFRQLFHWLGFALSTPTLLYSGWPFLKGAWTSLKTLHLGMDLPIAIGASVTWLYSSYVTFGGTETGEVYFDTVVNFIFVILVGRHLEGISKRHAVAATQRLMDLQPRVATLFTDGQEQVVPIRRVKANDLVLIKAGNKVSVDGIIIEGSSTLDEAMLSGESLPVNKTVGDTVSAGTINLSSALTVRVTGTLKETALGRIIRLVEEAQASKAPIQCTADMIVPWFVLATLVLAGITFFIWLGTDLELALMAATSVLIITCPCAFGLATPMAIAVASGQGARNGILIKHGEVLETLSHIDHFVFDKTGTLTEGRMRLQQIKISGAHTAEQLLILAASVEKYSEHSIASAVVEAAESTGLNTSNIGISDFRNYPGQGVSAVADGKSVLLGSLSWMEQSQVQADAELVQQAEDWEQAAVGSIHVVIDGIHAGCMGIADRPAPGCQKHD